MTTPCRGEVWWIQFDPQVGEEIGKTRPGVVVNIEEVGRLKLRIVVPMTDWKDKYSSTPWFVHLEPNAINGLQKVSAADCFQVKSMALERLRKKVGALESAEMAEIAAAIALCVGY